VSIEIHILLITVLVPASICAAFMLASWRPWRPDIERGFWGGAAGFGVAYVVGHALNVGRVPGIPPTQAEDWLPIVALGASLLGLAIALTRPRWWSVPLAGLIIGGGQAWALIGSLPERSRPWESGFAGAGVWIGVTLATAGAVWSYERLSERTRGPGAPAALWLALAGSSYLFLEFTVAKAMHLSGVLASACAVAAVLALWRPGIAISRGAALVAVAVYAGLWLFGVLFVSGVPAWVAMAAFAAPHAAWAGDLPGIRSLRPWQRTLFRLVAVSVAIGLVVGFGRPAPDPLDDLYQGY